MEHIDPRIRLVTALLFSLIVAVSNELATLGAALLVSGVGALSATGPRGEHYKRLVPVNGFLLILFLFLMFVEGGSQLALVILIKANALMLGLIALLGNVSQVTLAHALGHLGAPHKFTHLLLFTIRYLEVMQQEYQRLRAAMKTRGFSPGLNRHTYRTFGYLVGTLLVRSLDRSERIVAAMKCRGFSGRFYLLNHFSFSVHDIWFSLVMTVLIVMLVGLEFGLPR
ncbi:MAG: energy-coupling factor transporter transmembrane component T family protein [Planctomycetota bacterium]